MLAALALIGCSSSSGPAASGTRLTSPGANPADSKAADLRTRIDLLFGEHVMLIAKESSAARRGGEEYTTYLRLLLSNGNDLTEILRSALGGTAAARFDSIWKTQNDAFVSYAIGRVIHNQGKADAAMSSLLGDFVSRFSQFAADTTQSLPGPIALLVTQRVLQMKAMIDDQVAQNYPRMYGELRTAYSQSSLIGDALGPKIAQKFPDKFPGNTSDKAVDLRVTVNNLLQEHAYLATMTSSATVGGRGTEEVEAAGALADNTSAVTMLVNDLFGASVATQFNQIWSAKAAAMIGYASASTSTAKQRTLSQLKDMFVPQFSAFVQAQTGLAAFKPAVESQVLATITVIDDQRSKMFAKLGSDDRSAEASMELVADLIAAGIVTKLPSRFGQ
jgi:hypothetical protein